MFRIKSFAAIVLGGALAALPAFSQETGRSEATVQAFGSFVKSTTNNGVQQDATNSGGVLASYRFCDMFSASVGIANTVGPVINSRAFAPVQSWLAPLCLKPWSAKPADGRSVALRHPQSNAPDRCREQNRSTTENAERLAGDRDLSALPGPLPADALKA